MKKESLLFYVGVALVAFGILKPDISNLSNVLKVNPISPNISVTVSAPTDQALLGLCQPVIDSLKSGPSSRNIDGKRLSSLYADMATLIELDNDSLVIKNTEEIRESNSLAGHMLKLDMKGKYSNLAQACNNLVKQTIGEDNIVLSPELRSKSVSAFKALAWACYEGSK